MSANHYVSGNTVFGIILFEVILPSFGSFPGLFSEKNYFTQEAFSTFFF